jgi:ABC-type nitrate/sulfonate/bicarbonate transport system substrate-binding protein
VGFSLRVWKLCVSACLLFSFSEVVSSRADDIVYMAYGGHNETIGPYWVAVDKGLYQKHGIDARLLQVRNAQIS